MTSNGGRTAAILALCWGLAACSSGNMLDDSEIVRSPAETTASLTQAEPEAATVSASAETMASPVIDASNYQPSFHGLLVVQGGEGREKNAATLNTTWLREGTNQEFSTTLSPDSPTIIALNPGRYRLARAEGASGRSYLGGGSASAITINPGDVIYGGLILAREEQGVPLIETKDRINTVRSALKAEYPGQVQLLRKDLLAGTGG